MKVLMINKFLFPNGGSETYMFTLGKYLAQKGHEVQYFGMEHEGRCVSNNANVYTKNMDFHTGSTFSKLTYPLKTIYSVEAKKKLRIVLKDFEPDVCHINNFNYQLTPSIILEIDRWRKKTKKSCVIVYTAHDGQLVCPNHMFKNPITNMTCEKCLGNHYHKCISGKCIHGSVFKSVIAAVEAIYWNKKKTYKQIDTIICCSEFMKNKLDTNPILKDKTITLHNFVSNDKIRVGVDNKKEEYVLYFGRYSEEKGVRTLVSVCKELPEINFVFAGSGPLESIVNGVSNIKNIGFVSGEILESTIEKALFSVHPSECYENCPFTVIESIIHLSPVLCANIGGMPELVSEGETGELFESGNANELKTKISALWNNRAKCIIYSRNCANNDFYTIEEYYQKLKELYCIKD